MEAKIILPCLTAGREILSACHRLSRRGGRFLSERQKYFFLKKEARDEIWHIFREEADGIRSSGDRLFIQGGGHPVGNRTTYYGFLLDEFGIRAAFRVSRYWRPFRPAPLKYDERKYWRSSSFYRREINAGLKEKDLELVQGKIETRIFGR
ncbi:hypothetical protein A2303_02145 [Candidatus Falkowbacteria bacterium RIFOXYB2_FULL_47_14]|uniref:Uncharacterized protein n=1 Tax=Candidatus Falkowbacteria bacterium RIFOXYA2_FULL_47_19 TaxID=1797994 RepID=A0A1F5SFR7_9BACT|nr:MAG: hypothetical protein A2227_07325 [Candidatus Falkowbacteria bacterium RIFOXYA2_FULL_47_19]OGF35228.1 MAG: hypothetical protein A2468_00950 [Candidatus Falkowbacteria bacterium RIFOXYC2_FULL_46_15]OGF43868.1 MAG: hypothetical protein A2303_02145 [Candidatus Falkowbacteria bacterium RIFOXYB2_FULL_47_14]